MAAEISLAAEPVFHIGSWEVSNSVLTTWIVMAVIFVVIAILRHKGLKAIPKGFQNLFEAVVEFLEKNMTMMTGSKRKTLIFFPLVGTIFLFIMLVNWFGLLPGVGSIGYFAEHHGHEVFIPFLRAGTADLNMTLAIAVVAVFSTHIFGLRVLGVKSHLNKFFVNPLKNNPVLTGVGVLELFGELSKIISFSFRLFGNVFAGEVLLAVVTGLVGFIVPVPFYFLEIFVGFVQALVFATLTLVFSTLFTEEHH